jgi:BarA-like signal transduction histidine kinase
MKKLKVFLCHASDDKAEVKKMYNLLVERGADPWLDVEKLLPGQDWNLEIKKALDISDVILLCLSKKSVDKEGYVQREIRVALDRALEMPEGRIFLIPARLEECDLPYTVRTYQWVDLFVADGISKLLTSLNLRASQVNAESLSMDGTAPVINKPIPQKTEETKQSKTMINVQGNVTGSNIVIGNDNEVNG